MSENQKLRVVLLGASLDNDNMGVNVLAAGAVKCVLSCFPDAEMSFFDYAKGPLLHMLKVNGREVVIPRVNIRFSKKVYLPNNIAVLLLLGTLMKWIPARGLRRWILANNQWLRHLDEADIVLSIAGGDSFSDIYGLARFLYVSLPQILAIVMGQRLVLLPQTIGPFKRTFSRMVARSILRDADRVYARDSRSLAVAEALCGDAPSDHKCAFCYDVGFVVDAVTPVRLEELPVQVNSGAPLVGLNVSGLLFNGGYTHNNMFGLQTDYKSFVYELIDFLIRQKGTSVLLVPHVFGPAADSESDSVVCRQIWEELKEKYRMRLKVLRGTYDQSELKYVIGQCDFFVGSRMHACIAAVSQGVPAVSIAYSDKFIGVMEKIGVGSAVADARRLDGQAILHIVERTFDQRDEIHRGLIETMSLVKSTVLGLFEAEGGVRDEGSLVHSSFPTSITACRTPIDKREQSC